MYPVSMLLLLLLAVVEEQESSGATSSRPGKNPCDPVIVPVDICRTRHQKGLTPELTANDIEALLYVLGAHLLNPVACHRNADCSRPSSPEEALPEKTTSGQRKSVGCQHVCKVLLERRIIPQIKVELFIWVLHCGEIKPPQGLLETFQGTFDLQGSPRILKDSCLISLLMLIIFSSGNSEFSSWRFKYYRYKLWWNNTSIWSTNNKNHVNKRKD